MTTDQPLTPADLAEIAAVYERQAAEAMTGPALGDVIEWVDPPMDREPVGGMLPNSVWIEHMRTRLVPRWSRGSREGVTGLSDGEAQCQPFRRGVISDVCRERPLTPWPPEGARVLPRIDVAACMAEAVDAFTDPKPAPPLTIEDVEDALDWWREER